MAGRESQPSRRYAAAVGAVAGATLTRIWLDQALRGNLPFATYFAAVGFAAWYGGLGPALVALILGLGGAYVVVPSFATSSAASVVGVVLYLVVGLATIAFSEMLRRAQARAEAGAREARLQQQRLEEAMRERARAETLVGESERRFQTLAAHAPVGIFWTDAGGDCRYVNRQWCEITGRSPEESAGRGWIEALHPDDRERVVTAWYESRAASREFELEYRLRTPAGIVTWVSGRAVALRDAGGALPGYLGTVTDITERKRVERRVRAQHATTRVLAESARLGDAAPRILAAICECLEWEWGALWVVDRDADVLRCVDAWHPAHLRFPDFEATTRARTFVSGVGLPGRVWESGEPVWIADVVRDDNFPRAAIALREGLHGAFGFPILLGGAVLGVLEFFSRQIREPDAELHGMLLSVGSQIGQFIERKEAEEEVRASEARKSAILEAALDSIVSMDARGRITEFNPAAERTFGYRRGEVLGRLMAEVIIPPALRGRHRRGLEQYLKTGEGPVIGQRIELTAMRSDGSEFPVELTITRIASAGEAIFTGHIRDITERKQAEAERQTATRRWEFLAQASAVIASSLDYEETLGALARLVVPFMADWCTVDVTDADGTIRRLAVANADPTRAELARVAAVYHPDPHGRHPRTRVLRTGRSVLIPEVTDEGLAQAAGGPEHLRVMRALGYRSAMIVALTARGQMLGALTFATAESARRYGASDLAFAEELARRAAIAIDNARLYRDAQEANRMKDEFLATVSHELRTPLQAMLGWVAVLRQGKVNLDRRLQALDIIDRAGRAQAKLIEDLLDVSRIVTGRLRLDIRPTDLGSVIEDALDALRPAAEAKNVQLTAVLDPAIGPVAGDQVRLQQVVSNLLSNAVKFTPGGGRAEIRLERDDSEIRIVVKDTGQGIRPDFLPHVFEPFRQAEAASRRREGGLGLGLAIVRRVVELHGGHVEARSDGEGQGTEMLVTLPFRPLAVAASRSG